MAYTQIGRIRPRPLGAWSASAAYQVMDMVTAPDGSAAYIARQDVPAGTALTSAAHWAKTVDVSAAVAAADAAAGRADAAAQETNGAIAGLVGYQAEMLCRVRGETGTQTGKLVQMAPDAGSLLRVVSRIAPIQAGSGEASPSNVRPISGRTGVKLVKIGRNIISPPKNVVVKNATYTYDALNGAFVVTKGAEDTWGQIYYKLQDDVRRFVGQPLTLSFESYSTTAAGHNPRIILWDQNIGAMLAYVDPETGEKSKTFMLPDSVSALYIGIRIDHDYSAPEGAVFTGRGIQLELGDVPTAYDAYKSDTYTADFGQTVYGGTLDWTTGMLTVDMALATLDGSEDENWIVYTGSTGAKSFYNNNTSVLPGVAATGDRYIPGLCSWSQSGGDGKVVDLRRTQVDGNRIEIVPSVVAKWGIPAGDLAAFKAMLAANPMQVAYKLATPAVIQLTPRLITALEGTNAVYGDVESDVIWVKPLSVSIEEHLAAALAAQNANV